MIKLQYGHGEKESSGQYLPSGCWRVSEIIHHVAGGEQTGLKPCFFPGSLRGVSVKPWIRAECYYQKINQSPAAGTRQKLTFSELSLK